MTKLPEHGEQISGRGVLPARFASLGPASLRISGYYASSPLRAGRVEWMPRDQHRRRCGRPRSPHDPRRLLRRDFGSQLKASTMNASARSADLEGEPEFLIRSAGR